MNLANKLTIFRVILVPLMVIIPFFNIEGEILNIPVEFWIIDLIFIIASITDKLDGYIARSRNQITTFGKFLDPIADKILVISAMLILVEKGYLPAWIPAIVITREFIVSGYRLVASQKDGTVIAASVWGKLKTVTQMIAIILAFININGTNSFGKCFTGNLQGVELIINVLTTLCMIVSVIATIFSGYDYVKKRKRLIKLREVIRMLDKKQAKKRIDELIKETQYHAKKYYDDDKPEISDFEYDMLMNELKNLEKQFPEFIREDSLTQKVGGTVKKGFKKVEHEVPLQSLQDIFDFDELRAFDNRIKKEAEDSHK